MSRMASGFLLFFAFLAGAAASADVRLVDAAGGLSNVGLLQVKTDAGFGSVCGANAAAADVARQDDGAQSAVRAVWHLPRRVLSLLSLPCCTRACCGSRWFADRWATRTAPSAARRVDSMAAPICAAQRAHLWHVGLYRCTVRSIPEGPASSARVAGDGGLEVLWLRMERGGRECIRLCERLLLWTPACTR